MEVGDVRVAEDRDFERLRFLVDTSDDWTVEYRKSHTVVCTKITQYSTFKMFKVKSTYKDISASLLFDVLLDPSYRNTWDTYMLESYDVGCLNANNDVGYYAVRCPSPLKNRDFVLHRSWLEVGREHMVINHSVFHESLPPRKGFIRAVSYLTGVVIRPVGEKGCELNYISQCDPRGSLPSWVANKVTQICAPKMVSRLHKACLGYDNWKRKHNPEHKPWLNPEQMSLPRINLAHCIRQQLQNSAESLDESAVDESHLKDEEFFADA